MRAATIGRPYAVALLLAGCAIVAHGFNSPSAATARLLLLRNAPQQRNAAFPHVTSIRMEVADEPAAPKITIRKPGDAAAGGGASAAPSPPESAAKVTVRVRSKEERDAAAATDVVAEEEDDMSVAVTVKKPTSVPPPPSAPTLETQDLTDDEKILLEGTQKANCTMMLDALQAGANPNVRDPKGRTPLHFVSGLGLAPAAVLLIHFGAQVNVRDGDGLTPMHMAAGYANSQTLRVLVAAGADTEATAPAQGKPAQVIVALGDYQLGQFFNRTGADKLKKKDDKLEKLKACLDVLDDVEKVRDETDWDELLTEVLQCTEADKVIFE